MPAISIEPAVIPTKQLETIFSFLGEAYGLTPRQCQAIMIINDSPRMDIKEATQRIMVLLSIGYTIDEYYIDTSDPYEYDRMMGCM